MEKLIFRTGGFEQWPISRGLGKIKPWKLVKVCVIDQY